MQQDSGSGVRDELYKAVLLLASHTDSIEDRLARVYWSHIEPIDPAGLPAEAQVQFNWIREQLRKLYPLPGSVDGVDRHTAVLLAQNIILLHYAIKWRA